MRWSEDEVQAIGPLKRGLPITPPKAKTQTYTSADLE